MRKVEINGKQVTFETGKPLPEHVFGRKKSDFRLLLEAMHPGESVDLPLTADDMKTKSQTITTVSRESNQQYNYRTLQPGMVRIFCTEGTASKAPVQIRKASGW